MRAKNVDWEVLIGDEDLILFVSKEKLPVLSMRMSTETAKDLSQELKKKADVLETTRFSKMNPGYREKE